MCEQCLCICAWRDILLRYVFLTWLVNWTESFCVCGVCKQSDSLIFSLGSEECPFPYPPDVRKDWSPDSPVSCPLRPVRVHSYTQTEGPQPSSPTADASRPQPSLLVPVPPTLPSCPSPVPIRKHCAKWENRASVLQKPKELVEGSKPSYESLESVSARSSSHTPQKLCFVVL